MIEYVYQTNNLNKRTRISRKLTSWRPEHVSVLVVIVLPFVVVCFVQLLTGLTFSVLLDIVTDSFLSHSGICFPDKCNNIFIIIHLFTD